MYSNPISFPGLRLGPFDPDPVLFSVFGLTVKWYGFLMAAGFFLAALYGIKKAKTVGITGDHVSDALLFGVPAGIIGARIYYVVFNWQAFRGNPIRILYIWEGGMAVYGSIIGALAAAYIYSKVRKIPPLALMDLGVIGFLIGQCIGRWGNFFNREVYGYQTTAPWRMGLTDTFPSSPTYLEYIEVHPAFLYESLWTGIGFFLLNFLLKRRKYDGQMVLYYMAWYGLGRALIEGLRSDSLYLFNTGVRVSQLLSFALCAAGVAVLLFKRFTRKAEAQEQV